MVSWVRSMQRASAYVPPLPTHPCLCSRLSVQPVALCPPQERMLRVAGHVLTEGNTLLSDDELEKLTILRKNYSHLSRQKFNRIVVEP